MGVVVVRGKFCCGVARKFGTTTNQSGSSPNSTCFYEYRPKIVVNIVPYLGFRGCDVICIFFIRTFLFLTACARRY